MAARESDMLDYFQAMESRNYALATAMLVKNPSVSAKVSVERGRCKGHNALTLAIVDDQIDFALKTLALYPKSAEHFFVNPTARKVAITKQYHALVIAIIKARGFADETAKEDYVKL
jgi:hypothetical protein